MKEPLRDTIISLNSTSEESRIYNDLTCLKITSYVCKKRKKKSQKNLLSPVNFFYAQRWSHPFFFLSVSSKEEEIFLRRHSATNRTKKKWHFLEIFRQHILFKIGRRSGRILKRFSSALFVILTNFPEWGRRTEGRTSSRKNILS